MDETKKIKTEDYKISEYIDAIASKAPTPGGGSAAAVTASLAASLCMKVCNLTIGKKKYADVEDEMKSMLEKAESDKKKCVTLSDLDQLAFEKLSESFKLPETTDEEKKQKEEDIECFLKFACNVPITLMEICDELMEIADYLARHGSVYARSDAKAAKILATAAFMAAEEMVDINVRLMKDEKTADLYADKCSEMRRGRPLMILG